MAEIVSLRESIEERSETEWDLRVSDDLKSTQPPMTEKLTVLREMTGR